MTLNGQWPADRIDIRLTGVTPALTKHGPFEAEAALCGNVRYETRIPALVSKIVFHVPNLREYFGEPISDSQTVWCGRAEMSYSGWAITLDQTNNSVLLKELAQVGGFAFTHLGILSRDDNSFFEASSAADLLESLFWFFSFCNGRKTGPTLAVGYDEFDNLVWQQWHAHPTLPFKPVGSWNRGVIKNVLPNVYPGFSRRWNDSKWNDVIRSALYWYLEANAPGASIEAGIIQAVTALDTIGWTMVIEEGIKSEKRYDNDSIEKNLSDILAHCGIDVSIPPELSRLNDYGKWKSGPEAIAKIRNCRVHYSPKNREVLKRVGTLGEREASALVLEYLELVLLWLFDYNGEYCRRTARNVSEGQALRSVPWSRNN